MNENLPTGFYKGEDGVERYWDGTQWLEPSDKAAKGSRLSKPIVFTAVGVLVLGGAGAGGYFWFTEQQQQELELRTQALYEQRSDEVKGFLQDAVETCNAGEGVDVDERYLTVDGEGEEDYSGTPYFDVICIIEETGMPPAVRSRWGSTNSLQGLVEGNWNVLDGDAEIDAQWSYHPSSGPNVSLEIKSVFLEDFDYETHKDLIDEDDLNNQDENDSEVSS